jgi:two-component system, NarL family, sensor histidine kinase UhpB
MRSVANHLLQFPLRWKLIGANALLLLAGLVVVLAAPQNAGERAAALLVLFVAAAVNVVLVYLALAPLTAIQSVAEAVTHGDFGRRVPPMLLADRDADSSRRAFNRLLDHLAADNARLRRLAGEVTHAREVERVAVSHELREGVAQMLFALKMELGATVSDHGAPLAGARAKAAYAIATEAMEDVRRLAGTLTPPALSELGLKLALETLARRAESDQGGPAVKIYVDDELGQPSDMINLMLYRVAERAVRNVLSHGDVAQASIALRRRGSMFELDVEDDGVPIDPSSPDPLSAEPGLFGLREMLSQAGGDLRFETLRGARGTCVQARLTQPRPAAA